MPKKLLYLRSQKIIQGAAHRCDIVTTLPAGRPGNRVLFRAWVGNLPLLQT